MPFTVILIRMCLARKHHAMTVAKTPELFLVNRKLLETLRRDSLKEQHGTNSFGI